ncbi:alpha/beta hydrolase, putative [Plasmodium malariae]|uniref:Alpha/beta hydrolase, putative n=1 Tax=Plasmodium malariae TaxID=5858 RepID=A0A1D3TD63_PLAMA|nr:alpha/beta hydrolase, putative [Plasmodium malariae]SCP02836.1 alpha/beta hydrolase, putative [Plasmodium malariae]
MCHQDLIAHEYITCCKGHTFIVYSKNLRINDDKEVDYSIPTLNQKNDSPNNNVNKKNVVVLLLHGLNGGTYQFEKLFTSLIRFNYRFLSLGYAHVYVYFYGHGNSSLFENLNKFTEKLYTQQIYDVLEKKNVLNENFIVVAFSMGCIIAAHLSVDSKIKVKKFCLISAAGMAKPRHRFLIFLLKHNRCLFLRLAKRYSRSVISEDTVKNDYYNFENNLEDATKRYSILKENQEKFIETFLKVLIGLNIQDSKKQYSALLKSNVDVLFIYGREDKITPYAHTIKFLEKKKEFVKNVKMIILPECCHLVIHEKFNELVYHLMHFLE